MDTVRTLGLSVLLLAVSVACGGSGAPASDAEADFAEAERQIFETNDAQIAAMVAGTSTAEYLTSEWRGVNLNGTPMSSEGFEGEERAMTYDRIEVLDREVRVYGAEVAALRWHANFYVQVNGNPSFAEMRLLDVYVKRDGRWRNDLTQVTPIFGTVGNPPEE